MQRTVDVTTARRQFGTLLDEVFYKGDEIVIKRKGKVLARLVPANAGKSVSQADFDQNKFDLIQQLNSLPVLSITEDPTDVLRRIRAQKSLEAAEYDG